MPYHVYIVTNRPNGTLYIGVTNNLARRMEEHKAKTVDGFTAQYGLDRLVYAEEYARSDEAIHREKCMKEWKRAWKVRRILEMNPDWRDLSLELV